MYNGMLIYERAYLTFLEPYEGLEKLLQDSFIVNMDKIFGLLIMFIIMIVKWHIYWLSVQSRRRFCVTDAEYSILLWR